MPESKATSKHVAGELANKSENLRMVNTREAPFRWEDYVHAFFIKYPNDKLSAVKEVSKFGFRIEEGHKLIYYQVKKISPYYTYLCNNSVEKVIIDLKNQVMETLEIGLDKHWNILRDSSLDRVYCFKNQFDQMITINKLMYNHQSFNFFKRKMVNMGRSTGAEVMDDIVRSIGQALE